MIDDWRFEHTPHNTSAYRMEHLYSFLQMRGPRPVTLSDGPFAFLVSYPDDNRRSAQSFIRELFPNVLFSPKGTYAFLDEMDFAFIRLAAS